jgi:small conductance mechanosensitive channel
MTPENLFTLFNTYLAPLVWKLIGALAIWIIGGWIIKLLGKVLHRSLLLRKVDATLTRYIESIVNVALKILLIIIILGVLGIETTSFAAVLAAVGLAIGTAWGGLLANFAAGAFLITLRPFKVGDVITAAGITGEVKEIGLFATTIDSGDNVRVYVGNNKLFSDSIVNYTATPFRRVDLTAQIAHGVDPQQAIQRLKERVAQIPNVVKDPAPSIEILTFNEWGTVIAVRPYSSNANYWQVFFDTNKAIAEVGAQAGYPTPEQRLAVRQLN